MNGQSLSRFSSECKVQTLARKLLIIGDASTDGTREFLVEAATHSEGKKITWKDGFCAMWCIIGYRLTTKRRAPFAQQANAEPAGSPPGRNAERVR